MIKKSAYYRVFEFFNYTFILILTTIFLFPYLNVLAKAFNESGDTALGGVTFYPRVFTFVNMTTILKDPDITLAIVITLTRVLTGTALALFVQFMAAYAIAQKGMKGRKWFLMFFAVPMFISGGLIPHYILYSNINLINNFLVYILPTVFSFYNMIIIRTYIDTIPVSLPESARLDGANEFVIFSRIMLPLCLPILATITLWSAVGYWNDWTTTLYFVTKKNLFPLQYLLMQVINESSRIQAMLQQAIEAGKNTDELVQNATPESLKAAQIALTTLPIILVYPWLQKYFIKGVMIGSIKE